MKKIIFSEDFITAYSICGSLDINWVSNNINIYKEIEESQFFDRSYLFFERVLVPYIQFLVK